MLDVQRAGSRLDVTRASVRALLSSAQQAGRTGSEFRLSLWSGPADDRDRRLVLRPATPQASRSSDWADVELDAVAPAIRLHEGRMFVTLLLSPGPTGADVAASGVCEWRTRPPHPFLDASRRRLA
jgi:hypothetical protein